MVVEQNVLQFFLRFGRHLLRLLAAFFHKLLSFFVGHVLEVGSITALPLAAKFFADFSDLGDLIVEQLEFLLHGIDPEQRQGIRTGPSRPATGPPRPPRPWAIATVDPHTTISRATVAIRNLILCSLSLDCQATT